MRVIQVDCAAYPVTLQIGLQGENEATQVEFDLSAFADEFGAGQAELAIKRCGDTTPYPLELYVDGNNKATWTITNTDTAKAGHGRAQLSYYVDDIVKKTVIYTTYVGQSVSQGTVPADPYESYLERMMAIGAQVAASVELAQAAVEEAQGILQEMTALLANHNGIVYEE